MSGNYSMLNPGKEGMFVSADLCGTRTVPTDTACQDIISRLYSGISRTDGISVSREK